MKNITFNRNDVIFRQGDYPSSMFDIVSGKVGIYSEYGTDRQKQIAELGAGGLVGEMGMIDINLRSATAVALEDGTVLTEVSEQDFSEYFRSRPEMLLRIMKQLSSRIRETDEKLIKACRVIYESENNVSDGLTKEELLQYQLDAMCDAFNAFGY